MSHYGVLQLFKRGIFGTKKYQRCHINDIGTSKREVFEILTTLSNPWPQLFSVTEPPDTGTRQTDTIPAIAEHESSTWRWWCTTQVRRHNPSNVTLKMCTLKIETILHAHVTSGSSRCCKLSFLEMLPEPDFYSLRCSTVQPFNIVQHCPLSSRVSILENLGLEDLNPTLEKTLLNSRNRIQIGYNRKILPAHCVYGITCFGFSMP